MGSPRLLVIDDEPTILFAMRDYFEQFGLIVDCAADRQSAYDIVARNRYDLAIIDLRLSGTDDRDGLMVLRHLRSLSPPIKSIVLTAYGPEDAGELRALGAAAFFKKPTSLPVIARAVFDLTNHTPPPEPSR